MKTLFLALLLSAALFEQSTPDEEAETPIYYVGVFLAVAVMVFLIKKLKASEAANATRPREPKELR